MLWITSENIKKSLLFSVLNLVQGIHPFRFPIAWIVEVCKDNTGLSPSLYLWTSMGCNCSLPNVQGYDLCSPCHSGSHILLDPVEIGLLSFSLCSSWVTNGLVPRSTGSGSALSGQLFSYKCFCWYLLKLPQQSPAGLVGVLHWFPIRIMSCVSRITSFSLKITSEKSYNSP